VGFMPSEGLDRVRNIRGFMAPEGLDRVVNLNSECLFHVFSDF
jgi:hypothetical protein